MAKPRNNISSLLTQLSKSGSGRGTASLSSTQSAIRQSSSPSGQLSLGLADTRKLGFSDDRKIPTGINFGKAPATPEPSTGSSSNQLTTLLTQTASQGLASALGGSFGLGTFGGIGSIISAIGSLFGGHKKEQVPLVQFSLPKPQNQTKYVSTKQQSTSQNVSKSLPGAQAGGIYGSSNQANQTLPADDWAETHSAQIAQAVKTALLNSSSLNDVIAEI